MGGVLTGTEKGYSAVECSPEGCVGRSLSAFAVTSPAGRGEMPRSARRDSTLSVHMSTHVRDSRTMSVHGSLPLGRDAGRHQSAGTRSVPLPDTDCEGKSM